ncbi:pyruvate ferredoxin oxidoreductase, beta subunit [Thermosulfidibacter takaii ABI70S6]|uniref:Pyruvate ferredoxin oxidoreductase, beta subunit n=1 Tax=Thermosulfidibacter takaii (strain DSM 17441 / JCM 13301 / NBRC 103674 / ABI70S6) TaxID=1298851 RepID=A0A0S3QTX5_THET7|nr:thiamine pyrophosphate-dependent enzyme [Thermosulfidibacter takaii]BAT71796.1 pyruvate ferredoxin oxidoreductase, beta subunit [Thermosulfidibacter takaii ABI70S6]
MDIKERFEGLSSGHLACAGCGAALAMKLALRAIGPDCRVVIPASCWSVIAGRHPDTSLKVPLIHTTFEVAPSVATGIRRALDRIGLRKTTVMVWAGDGSTYDIGLAALSATAERNEDIIYVCYDNEAYMNTGIQRSSSTPYKAWTTTTPKGKLEQKKNMILTMFAHKIPYIATATVALAEDLMRKFEKARSIRGFKFILILSPCTPGWRIRESDTIKVSRLAVETGFFPLLEIENGKWKINYTSGKRNLEEYLRIQGRFQTLTEEDIGYLKAQIKEQWDFINLMVEGTNDH